MTELFVGGLTLIAMAAIYAAFELLDLLPGRRTRERVQGVLAVIILGVASISPRAFTAAIDWYSHRKVAEIQNEIKASLPTTATHSP